MRVAYIDTSCFVSIAFHERGASALRRKLEGFDDLFSSNLLEAELCAACSREGVESDPVILSAVSWVMPDRPLSAAIARVLEAGYVRGAACWHLATALFMVEDPAEISFLTLDGRQAQVARALGFGT